ncbi:diacylglycerol kinase [Candidatus Parcubacteria bacterium]|nr:MAG: diacylglycerol kinase [Candidatus Parcubacteria bacterium]
MISIIVAIGKNNAIGLDNQLLWHIPEDLKHFKKITTGNIIVMGRKTYESIGRALPSRTNIIITRDTKFQAEGCIIKHSLEEVFREAKSYSDKEVFIIGGGEIYKQALPHADKLYLTIVDDEPKADTFFPEYSEFSRVISEDEHEQKGIKFKFIELEK